MNNAIYLSPVLPSIDMTATGERIQYYCCKNNLKAKDLQQIFGFRHPQAVYNWLSGKTLPSIDNLLALSNLFHTSVNDLLVTHDMGVSYCA